jgi:hypothetical protein
MEQHDQRMEDARFAVLTQDNLGELYTVATAIEGGAVYAPLDAADRARLLELQERKHVDNETLKRGRRTPSWQDCCTGNYSEQYGDLITRRADHIKHTMRMVRIHKARQIIERRDRETRSDRRRKKAAVRVGRWAVPGRQRHRSA